MLEVAETEQAQPTLAMEYRNDPVFFVEHALSHKTWGKQRSILRSVAENKKTAVRACHGSSKCIAASEYITLANGKRVVASELVGKKFNLLTPINGKIKATKAHAEWNMIEPVFELQTETGRTVVRNAQHLVWAASGVFPSGNRCKITPIGWTPINKLKPKMLVAVPTKLPAFGKLILPEYEIKLLAYLIGDGGYTGSGVIFSQSKGIQLIEFKECAEAFGCHLIYRSGVDWRVVGPDNMRKVSSKGMHRINPITDILRAHKLMGKHSRDKRIPPAIFSLPKERLRLFLSRLYSTDGWASSRQARGRKSVLIGFCSASQGLIQDLQELLLRFNICSRVYKIPNVNAWNLVIASSYDVLSFCKEIGIFGKEEAVEKCRINAEKQQASKQRQIWRYKEAPLNMRWERVKHVIPRGNEATVAIEVPETHTFISTFWEHNTFSAAEIVVWFLNNFDNSKVITTAPTFSQIKNLLWAEISQIYQTSRIQLEGECLTTIIKTDQADHYAIGFSTDKPSRAEGWHAPALLFIFDEAKGIEQWQWDSVRGLMTGGFCRWLVISTTDGVGVGENFYKAFEDKKSDWNKIHISAEESPYVTGEMFKYIDMQDLEHPERFERKEISPEELNVQIASPEWIKECEREWGRDSVLFLTKVKGEIADQGADTIIKLSQVKKMEENWEDEKFNDEGQEEAGVDVARGGDDDTVFYRRKGLKVVASKVIPSSSLTPKAKLVFLADELETFVGHNRDMRIKIDDTGVGGGITDIMESRDYNVVPINFQQTANDPDKYPNMISEMWFEVARFIHEIACPEDDRLKKELVNRKYLPELDKKGRRVVESKKDYKKRGFPSPDKADSFLLCFHNPHEEIGDVLVAG